MEERAHIVKELFELRIYLNKSNVKVNQKTELKFEINKKLNGTYEFICFVNSAKKFPYIVLSYKIKQFWSKLDLNRFPYLEEFCTYELNKNEALLKDQKKLANYIQKRLFDLGISQK